MACRRDPHASGKGIFLTLVISLPDCSMLPPDCPYSLLLVRTVTLDGRQPPQATLEHSLPCLGSPYSTPLCPLEPPSSPSSSILEESVPPWAHPRGRVQNPPQILTNSIPKWYLISQNIYCFFVKSLYWYHVFLKRARLMQIFNHSCWPLISWYWEAWSLLSSNWKALMTWLSIQ